MKALLMAAGVGTRISRYIEGKPKCTLDIGGTALIDYTISQLEARGINEIGMILGYQSNVIEDILKKHNIKYYYNFFYDVTNSIASAWFAKEFFDDDMIVMNADVYLEEQLIDKIFSENQSPILFADSSRKEEADYKFYYENNQLIKFGKDLTGEDISGEYVGIAKIQKNFLKEYLTRLDEFIKDGRHGKWWEDVLYSFALERPIYIRDINGMFWAEVDFIEDYERILEFRGIKKKNYIN